MGATAERIDLDGAALKEDPARLSDEAAALSMFGEKRFIRVTGGDECTEAVDALLSSGTSGDPVVLIAGALKPTSTLLKRALSDRSVLACQSFKPEGRNADELAVALGRSHGLRLSREIAHSLAASCLGDRAVLEREIEKLSLYLDAAPDRPREADAAALDAIGAGLDEVDTAALVDAVMDGRPIDVSRELSVLADSNAGLIPALRGIARRIATLARLRGEVEAGARPANVMANRGQVPVSQRARQRRSPACPLGRGTAADRRDAYFRRRGSGKDAGDAGRHCCGNRADRDRARRRTATLNLVRSIRRSVAGR